MIGVIRGVVAFVLGLTVAALLSVLLIGWRDLPNMIASGPRLLGSAGLLGIVMTTPAWAIASLLVLPVVSHRVSRHGLPNSRIYYTALTFVGVIAITPVILLLGLPVQSWPVFLTCGAIGGLCFAAAWHIFVLRYVASRRTSISHGATRG